MSRSSDIIILIGAGASVEAAIPASGMMIGAVEKLLDGHTDWQPFEKLYNHIKSAIYYAAGLKGRYNDNVAYNIETLVNTLHELERNELLSRSALFDVHLCTLFEDRSRSGSRSL